MRKVTLLACIMAAGFLAANVYANCGSCPGDAKKAPVKKGCCPKAAAAAKGNCGGCMGGPLANLDLTEKQKEKIDKIRADCKKKIDNILTDEQRAKMNKICGIAADPEKPARKKKEKKEKKPKEKKPKEKREKKKKE